MSFFLSSLSPRRRFILVVPWELSSSLRHKARRPRRSSCVLSLSRPSSFLSGESSHHDNVVVGTQTQQVQTTAVVHENTSARQALDILTKNNDVLLVYRGRFGQGQALLAALQRRLRRQRPAVKLTSTVAEQWNAYRQRQAWHAQVLNRFTVQARQGAVVVLPHVHSAPPHVATALTEILSAQNDKQADQPQQSNMVPWREIQARVAAAQWQTKGIWIPALQSTIHPHFDVYPPTRQDEYLKLLPRVLEDTPNNKRILLDIGTGTGLLTAVLLQQHQHWTAVATDISPLAATCTTENLQRLDLADRVQVVQTTANAIFPAHVVADVIVCNPPWIPQMTTTNASWLDCAIYDNDNEMLRGFLIGAASHLRNEQSEVWLILSDLAEHLQLRSRAQLEQWIDEGGLEIVDIRSSTVSASTGKGKVSKRQAMEEQFFPKVAQARRAERIHLFRLQRKT